jgi:outer membrane protein TolC
MRHIMGRTRIDKIGYRALVWGLWAVYLLGSSPAIAAEGTDLTSAAKDRPVPLPLSSPLTFETRALPLTRQDAVYLALLNSRDIRIERLVPEIVRTDIQKERGVFDPAFYSAGAVNHTEVPAGNILAGSNAPTVEAVTWSSGLRAKLISGAVASLDFVNSWTDGNSKFLTLNPQFSSSLFLTLTQPLLKDFGPSINRARLKLADNNAAISRYQLQTKVASVLADVENTYWELVLGLKENDIRRRSLELTQRLAERTREMIQEGFLPESAKLQADAAVALRESDLTLAANTLRDTLSRLQDILNLDPKLDVQIIPLDQPTLEDPKVDSARAVQDALARRPELPQAKLDLKNRGLSLDIAKNQVLPQLNLFFSYGLAGLAGDARNFSNPAIQTLFAQQQIPPSSLTGSYGTTLGNLFSGSFPSWSVGLNLSVPIGNVAAQSQLRRATLEQQKAALIVKDVEQKIVFEVERSARQIQTLKKAIASAQAARAQSSRHLEATNEQFDLGLASMSSVLDAERELALAEREEWRTIVDYNKVLVSFDRATGATLEKYRVSF